MTFLAGVHSILLDTRQAWGIGSLISKFRVSCVAFRRSGLLSNCRSCFYNFLVHLTIGVLRPLGADSDTFISLGFLKLLAFETWQVSETIPETRAYGFPVCWPFWLSACAQFLIPLWPQEGDFSEVISKYTQRAFKELCEQSWLCFLYVYITG